MYTTGMKPSRTGKRTENLTIKVSEELKGDIEMIAQQEARTVSNVAFLLIERGLDSFRRDGRLVVYDPETNEIITVPSFGRAEGDIKNRRPVQPESPTRTAKTKPQD